MQELPELHIYRSQLAEQFAGAQITGIEVVNTKSFQENKELLSELVGKVVLFIERRGKHLLFHLDNGRRLVLQFGKESYLYKGTALDQTSRAAQVKLFFEDRILFLVGLRADDIQVMKVKEIEEQLRALGPDALDKKLTLDRFIERFAKKRGSIKSALMDQNVISGIGPVYSDEICFAAAVRPDAKIPVFESETWERLYDAMHSVLEKAISEGGAGVQTFEEGDSLTGGYREYFLVYGREDQTCSRCGGNIRKIDISSRKAYVCPGCQKDQ
ncbi:Fpg/Nei family DNA glycosylase [Paenibacillus sp. sgz302251]|uniref:Fpg/Nei family DNA glycosylase n=1 Tax=Paenibacillus sp. sgz302251 TaxID=3414493 RepID=UPI003C7C60B4